MKLRLQENPREWMKFTGVMAFLLSLLAFVLFRKGVLDITAFWATTALAAGAVITSLFRPRWFRGFYRAGMIASWHVGQVMGYVVLTVFYFLVVVPMGLALRLAGKDLLELRKPVRDSYWHQPRKPGPFERHF